MSKAYRAYGCLCGLFLLGAAALVACTSPATDANHGVGKASYREVLTKVGKDYAEIRSDVIEYATTGKPPSSQRARALLLLIDADAAMVSSTLAGNGQ